MPLKAMLFDLDGTITRPRLDFPAIKREIGISANSFILEELEKMSPAARRRAMAIVERHEEEAARKSELNDGARELLDALARRGVATAVVTRNSLASVKLVLERHGLRFTTAVCREQAAPKPSPAGIVLALARLNVPPAQAIYVGDHAIDINAGRAGGVRTIWVTNGRQPASPATVLLCEAALRCEARAGRPAGDFDPAPEADFVVAGLREIIALLDALEAS